MRRNEGIKKGIKIAPSFGPRRTNCSKEFKKVLSHIAEVLKNHLKKILRKKERKTEIVFSEYFSEKGFRQLTKAMRKSTITAVGAAELVMQLANETQRKGDSLR